MALGETLSKFFDAANKILAFVVLLAYVLFAINANWTFIDNTTIIEIINAIMRYGPLVICGLVMIEFAIKRNLIIQIIVYAIIAVAVIFQFFPDTFAAMVTQINGAFGG
ncbi:MAG: hypothetical protein IJ301_02590 [Clostridia bacterium]|nr:hypothetical protein [Clostridia bacterium]